MDLETSSLWKKFNYDATAECCEGTEGLTSLFSCIISCDYTHLVEYKVSRREHSSVLMMITLLEL